jgi:ribosome-associated protein
MEILGQIMSRRKKKVSDEPAVVSKSQRKRDAQELKSLAGQLIGLSKARLAQVPLEEPVREAVEEARQIRSHVARKRQLQFIAKLLRRTDATEIFDSIEAFNNEARQLTARQHRSEAWRDFLLESGDAALGQLLEKRHDADAQSIRQLLRNAHREAQQDKPPASLRALFRMLRDLDEMTPLPPP